MNIILTDQQRQKYQSSIDELLVLCPETMQRKLPRANVQQAFILDTIKRTATLNNDLLCVGSYEDTACETLIKLGYKITEIDPVINTDLLNYYNNNMNKTYDIIFSTSVIEHVRNDEQFIDRICKLLKPKGYGILTCDFKNDYKKGDPKPGEDIRLYTKNDLLVRLNKILKTNKCSIYGNIDYDYEPDFHYETHIYSFATYMFRKE